MALTDRGRLNGVEPAAVAEGGTRGMAISENALSVYNPNSDSVNALLQVLDAEQRTYVIKRESITANSTMTNDTKIYLNPGDVLQVELDADMETELDWLIVTVEDR